ncbi:Hypothetical_protein [Hexamita inflata]|uniref:Hypothetical_protein n=1 Tax=Hexamita inflata TaxID=28002 RepID=A0ABP1GZ48_9EUKA
MNLLQIHNKLKQINSYRFDTNVPVKTRIHSPKIQQTRRLQSPMATVRQIRQVIPKYSNTIEYASPVQINQRQDILALVNNTERAKSPQPKPNRVVHVPCADFSVDFIKIDKIMQERSHSQSKWSQKYQTVNLKANLEKIEVVTNQPDDADILLKNNQSVLKDFRDM